MWICKNSCRRQSTLFPTIPTRNLGCVILLAAAFPRPFRVSPALQDARSVAEVHGVGATIRPKRSNRRNSERQSRLLHPTPKPGQMRLWCWNSIANGADGIVFFRWRSLPYGAEAHWNGLRYHDERNTWRLDEAKQLGQEIQRLGPNSDGYPVRFALRRSCTISTTSHTQESSTPPDSNVMPASARSIGRFRKDICLQMFSLCRALEQDGDLDAYQDRFLPPRARFGGAGYEDACRITWRAAERWFSAAGAPTETVTIGATMPPERNSTKTLWAFGWRILQ